MAKRGRPPTRQGGDGPKAADFLAGVKPKSAPPVRKHDTLENRKTADAPVADTLQALQAQMLEQLAPKALEHIKAAIEDEGDRFTPEYKHKLALQLLDRVGAGKGEARSAGGGRADLATLHAVNDRLAAILARAEARSVAPNVAEMFG
jgi:hypothetical protein